jgi:hypothetical protein
MFDVGRQLRNGDAEAPGGQRHRGDDAGPPGGLERHGGEERDREHRGQRVAREGRVLEGEVEHQIRQREGRHRGEGPAFADDEEQRAQDREHQHDTGESHAVPRPDERAEQRERGQPRRGVEIEHLHAGEVLAGLAAERRQVRLRAAARHQQRHGPGKRAGRERDRRPEHRAGDAAAHPVEQHEPQQRCRDPQRLRSEAD